MDAARRGLAINDAWLRYDASSPRKRGSTRRVDAKRFPRRRLPPTRSVLMGPRFRGDDGRTAVWWEAAQERLVHAHRLELLAPGVRDRSLAAVGQHDRRAVGCVQREQLHAGLKLRRLREHGRHVLGADGLDVSNLAAAKQRQSLRRDFADSDFVGGHGVVLVVSHGPRLLSICDCRVLVASQSLSAMLMVFTTRSGSGRARSIDNSPFFRSAPSTSMPSASTKVRWNWRAAMPRWRYCRDLSSTCRPRMSSWLSSTVTSSWSRVKPATASVIRSRSGCPFSRGTRSML